MSSGLETQAGAGGDAQKQTRCVDGRCGCCCKWICCTLAFLSLIGLIVCTVVLGGGMVVANHALEEGATILESDMTEAVQDGQSGSSANDQEEVFTWKYEIHMYDITNIAEVDAGLPPKLNRVGPVIVETDDRLNAFAYDYPQTGKVKQWSVTTSAQVTSGNGGQRVCVYDIWLQSFIHGAMNKFMANPMSADATDYLGGAFGAVAAMALLEANYPGAGMGGVYVCDTIENILYNFMNPKALLMVDPNGMALPRSAVPVHAEITKTRECDNNDPTYPCDHDPTVHEATTLYTGVDNLNNIGRVDRDTIRLGDFYGDNTYVSTGPVPPAGLFEGRVEPFNDDDINSIQDETYEFNYWLSPFASAIPLHATGKETHDFTFGESLEGTVFEINQAKAMANDYWQGDTTINSTLWESTAQKVDTTIHLWQAARQQVLCSMGRGYGAGDLPNFPGETLESQRADYGLTDTGSMTDDGTKLIYLPQLGIPFTGQSAWTLYSDTNDLETHFGDAIRIVALSPTMSAGLAAMNITITPTTTITPQIATAVGLLVASQIPAVAGDATGNLMALLTAGLPVAFTKLENGAMGDAQRYMPVMDTKVNFEANEESGKQMIQASEAMTNFGMLWALVYGFFIAFIVIGMITSCIIFCMSGKCCM